MIARLLIILATSFALRPIVAAQPWARPTDPPRGGERGIDTNAGELELDPAFELSRIGLDVPIQDPSSIAWDAAGRAWIACASTLKGGGPGRVEGKDILIMARRTQTSSLELVSVFEEKLERLGSLLL